MDHIPQEAFCPICMQCMKDDPVICSDGHTYDRRCIQKWLDLGHRTSPKTNKNLSTTELISNHALRNMIQALLENLPEAYTQELRGTGTPLDLDASALHAPDVLASKYPTDQYICQVMRGSQSGTDLEIHADAGSPAAIVREMVAEKLNELDDSYGGYESLVSRIRLKVEGIEVNYQEGNLPQRIQVDIVEDFDWQNLAANWEDPRLLDFVKGLSSRPTYDDPDVKWDQTPEFSEIIRTVNSLQTGQQTRGSKSPTSDETFEIMEVLQEALCQRSPTPGHMLMALKDEFG